VADSLTLTQSEARSLVVLGPVVLLTNIATVLSRSRPLTFVVGPACLIAVAALVTMLYRIGWRSRPDGRRLGREWCRSQWWRTELASRTGWDPGLVNRLVGASMLAWLAAQVVYLVRLAT
jgi:hypothetical protein